MKRYMIVLLTAMCLSILGVCIYKVIDHRESFDEAKHRKYITYLEQIIEREFMDEENIESADAVVSYDRTTDQYSVELSLTGSGEISEERIGIFKSALAKIFTKIILEINGEIV